jgi:hypothetical protein
VSLTNDVARDRGSDATDVVVSAVTLTLDPTAVRRLEGHPVIRRPDQLRLHPALGEVRWTGMTDELNHVARLKSPSVPVPILITTSGTILAGFGRWQLAVLESAEEISCIEYPLSEDEALQFILEHHQPLRGWNSFARIRLALTLEPYFQRKALANMRAGGMYKGSANLPDLDHIDVRQEIASIAGVGARNIRNTKVIIQTAHPRLIAALLEGTLSIHCAMKFCKLPPAEQLEQFVRYKEDSAVDSLIRRAIPSLKTANTELDVAPVLDALRQKEIHQPGSVRVRVGRLPQTVILLGQDLLSGPLAQRELKLT